MTTLSKLIVYTLIVFIYACGNQAEVKDNLTLADTLAKAGITSEENSLLSKFPEINGMTYKLTADEIEDLKKGDTLHWADVSALSNNIVKENIFAGINDGLEAFRIIDSVKQAEKYKKWLEKQELAATIYADAFSIGKLKTGENSWILFWMLSYSTEQQCPYASTTSVMATSFVNNEPQQTILFAEIEGATDAPVSFSGKTSGTFDGSKITLVQHDEEENGDPETIFYDRKHELMFSNGNFGALKTLEDKTKTVKHEGE